MTKDAFIAAFTTYYRRAKPGGQQDYRDDPNYVHQYGADYYRTAKRQLSPVEYEEFFRWLEQNNRYFIKADEFPEYLRKWRGLGNSKGVLPALLPDFVAHLKRLVVISLATGGRDGYRIADICQIIQGVPVKQESFHGADLKESIDRLRQWFRKMGVSAVVLNQIEEKAESLAQGDSRI